MPNISFEPPLEITEEASTTLIEGQGVELAQGSALMLSYVAVDSVTGEVIEENFGEAPEIALVDEESTGVLYDSLVGATEGTRLLRLEHGTDDRPNPTIFVYDIRHTQAWGEELPLADDAPQIEVSETGEPLVIIPDATPPAELQVIGVLRGDGPQVRSGQSVTVRYTTVSWTTGEVADTLWGEGLVPTTIPFRGLIPAWQDGLVDQRVGSRVMILTPPGQAFGTDNLVFIIDVLALSQAEDEPEDGEEPGEEEPEEEESE